MKPETWIARCGQSWKSESELLQAQQIDEPARLHARHQPNPCHSHCLARPPRR